MVDFTNGTPLELADGKPGTPVTFWRKSWNPFTRYKFGCIIHHYKAADEVAWLDAHGVRSADIGGLTRVRNVNRQSHWICNDTTFWHRDEAIACANSNGLTEPMEVTEVVTGEYGKVISRSVLSAPV
jgi:hypothetical protein